MPIHYTDPRLDVPPGVDFLDPDQVRSWVAACEVDKPWRKPMRQRFADLIGALLEGAQVLELGSGPALLAEAILQQCRNVGRYTLLDFSPHMLDLGRERLAQFEDTEFVLADFKEPDWFRCLPSRYTAVVAMQAIHEIRHKHHVPKLYRQIRDLLVPGGLFAVCDHLPKDPSILQTHLYMTAGEQAEALKVAGFERVQLVEESWPIILVTGHAPH